MGRTYNLGSRWGSDSAWMLKIVYEILSHARRVIGKKNNTEGYVTEFEYIESNFIESIG